MIWMKDGDAQRKACRGQNTLKKVMALASSWDDLRCQHAQFIQCWCHLQGPAMLGNAGQGLYQLSTAPATDDVLCVCSLKRLKGVHRMEEELLRGAGQ